MPRKAAYLRQTGAQKDCTSNQPHIAAQRWRLRRPYGGKPLFNLLYASNAVVPLRNTELLFLAKGLCRRIMIATITLPHRALTVADHDTFETATLAEEQSILRCHPAS
jgi:hypothetical protein